MSTSFLDLCSSKISGRNTFKNIAILLSRGNMIKLERKVLNEWNTCPWWNVSCPSLRAHLSQQMTLRDLGNIHTPGNSCRAYFHSRHGPKITSIFLPVAATSRFVLLTKDGTVQPENIISVASKWQIRIFLRW